MSGPEPRWQADLDAALADAEVQISELTLSRLLRRAAVSTINRSRKATRDRALQLVEDLRTELTALDAVMGTLHAKGVAAEKKEAAEHPYGDAWLSRLRRDLSKTTDTPERTAKVVDAWAAAIGARRWDTADAVIAMEATTLAPGTPVETLSVLGRELRHENWDHSLRLIDKLLATRQLPEQTEVRLLVAKCRVCLYRAWNPDAALAAAEQARDRAMDGPRWAQDLARAAAAEAWVEVGAPIEAHAIVDGVLDQPVGAPDLLVIAGVLREHAGDRQGAEDHYDAAVLRFGERATAGHLYAPQPVLLLWRGARKVRSLDPESALALLDLALELAEQEEPGTPHRQPWIYRARLLEELGRTREAAAAYHTAARRYDDSGQPAVALYQQAHELAPDIAKYRWSYAEALRTEATATPPADMDTLEKARGILDESLADHHLDADHAWVLVTSAMIGWDLGRDDALILAERSVVLDPDYARGYAFIALMQRERGYLTPAVDAARGGYLIDRTDPFVVTQFAFALACTGEGDRAIEVLDHYIAYFDLDPDAITAKSSIELWQDRPQEALATLGALHDSGLRDVLLAFAQTQGVLGNEGEEQRIYRTLADSSDGERTGLPGWAAYRLGRYDDALEHMRDDDLRNASPTSPIDRAQVLIARGRGDDVETGRLLMLDGIGACDDALQLLHLSHVELPMLGRGVHVEARQRVQEIVNEATVAVERRIEELQDRSLDSTTVEGKLAQARVAAATGGPAEAVGAYVALSIRDELPEVPHRLRLLGEELLSRGDARLLARDLGDAMAIWKAADTIPPHLDGVGKVLRRIDARLGLAELVTGPNPTEECQQRLSRSRAKDLLHVVPYLVWDLVHLHAVLAGLRRAAMDSRMPWREHLTDLERSAYQTLLDPRHDDTDHAAGARQHRAIEINLSESLAHLHDEGQLAKELHGFRERLSIETGIQIPGVKVAVQDTLGAGTARFTVYGRHVRDYRGAEPGAESLSRIMAAFEEVVRHNLFRWITVDDLYLWCADWQPERNSDDELTRFLPSTPWAKLQLTRLLKMLLREGVPVRDRRRILESFAATQLPGGPSVRTTYEALRHTLDPVHLAATSIAIPESLEQRIADAMSVDGQNRPLWATPRTEANQLVSDLRLLVGRDHNAETVVTVSDPDVRSYVWRLLASERPRVRVAVREGQP